MLWACLLQRCRSFTGVWISQLKVRVKHSEGDEVWVAELRHKPCACVMMFEPSSIVHKQLMSFDQGKIRCLVPRSWTSCCQLVGTCKNVFLQVQTDIRQMRYMLARGSLWLVHCVEVEWSWSKWYPNSSVWSRFLHTRASSWGSDMNEKWLQSTLMKSTGR